MRNLDPGLPAPYHHGDLRSALLKAAAEEISTAGAAQLSLRGLARRVGVSHAAPAHHFGDKTGLLTALAAEGFRILHEHTSPALGRPDALVRAGEQYVAFALTHPAHFSVMFDPHLLRTSDAALDRERTLAFDNFFAAVQQTTGTNDAGQVAAQAMAAWSVVHGVAVLWLQGNLPFPLDAGCVPAVFAQLGAGLRTVAVASAKHLPEPSPRRLQARAANDASTLGPMWRAALTSLIAVAALTGCGTRTGPAVASGGTRTSTSPPAASGRTGSSASPAAAGSKTERPPTCYPVIFTENSGNGPTYHVQICDALPKPRPGQEWQLVVDGGRLASRAVIFGQQVPRRPAHSR